jgi:two-component system response regulator FixJ
MSRNVPIYIVDDDLEVCRSLALLLRSEGFSTSPYVSAEQLLDEIGTADVGVVISDVCMPRIDGLAFLAALRKMGRADPIIFITGHADVPMAVKALKQGAFHFLEKPFSKNDMVSAVDEAVASVANLLDQAPSEEPDVISRLSKREHQVLAALMDGATNKRIAGELGISPRTVEIHRANLMEKTGAGTLSKLIRIAIDAGFRPA